MGHAWDVSKFLSLCEQLNTSVTIKPDLERRGYVITVKKENLTMTIDFGREEIRKRFFGLGLRNAIKECAIKIDKRLEQRRKAPDPPEWKRFLKNRFERME